MKGRGRILMGPHKFSDILLHQVHPLHRVPKLNSTKTVSIQLSEKLHILRIGKTLACYSLSLILLIKPVTQNHYNKNSTVTQFINKFFLF